MSHLKRPAEDSSAGALEPAKKTKTDLVGTEIVLHASAQTQQSKGDGSKENQAEEDSQLLPRTVTRISLDINPTYLTNLRNRNVLGYHRAAAKKKLALNTVNLVPAEIRNSLTICLTQALTVLYNKQALLRATEITSEIAAIVPLTVDVTMTAIYAKLRLIHRAFTKHSTRYSTAPSYAKDVEIPLPFALLVQELGSFETAGFHTNSIAAPTYPEGTNYEGRASAEYKLTDYLSYLPSLKSLGIPCKSVDTRLKSGSAWWTYLVENNNSTVDLRCTLPASNYSDHSAILRSLLITRSVAAANKAADIVDANAFTTKFAVRLREFGLADCSRSFLALCHTEESDWNLGSS